MCSAAAVWSNVTTVVYGASIAETVALGKARIQVTAREIVAAAPATVEVFAGYRRDECLELYR